MHEDNEEVFHQHIDKVITTGSNKDIFVVLNDWNDKVAYQPKHLQLQQLSNLSLPFTACMFTG
ncbi:hypothetical protein C0Q70_09285 [Pomacea canaliculata]|uniref:Uncharacterized protein n=1 Tax=Pomacea canaliculata TaxID=400727 RepID=A0A2T7P9D0_POMCA|nr:hypothetical protein C0Q70_09285 [Pomacea canaliculata]